MADCDMPTPGLPRGPPPPNHGHFSLGPPIPVPGSFPFATAPRCRAAEIHNHPPGEFCFFCACRDCRFYFGAARPIKCVDPSTLEATSKNCYMGFVNSLRAAAAKREEEREEISKDEREISATEAAKKDKAPKEQPKKKSLRQNMKRRKQ